ncbi:hypothetical protein EVAR_2914_1 [Eumeta japonica]|uniref:Uncharacterized protein n=1 Tax=Eumeta variegata TaxID=151549 RepID=A0A4C1T3U2_EUMVA|nr:hypothetical protein EVAR_2914_1 [Eumeta japonica]
MLWPTSSSKTMGLFNLTILVSRYISTLNTYKRHPRSSTYEFSRSGSSAVRSERNIERTPLRDYNKILMVKTGITDQIMDHRLNLKVLYFDRVQTAPTLPIVGTYIIMDYQNLSNSDSADSLPELEIKTFHCRSSARSKGGIWAGGEGAALEGRKFHQKLIKADKERSSSTPANPPAARLVRNRSLQIEHP